jgi:conjugative transfer signal peptidase TraF
MVRWKVKLRGSHAPSERSAWTRAVRASPPRAGSSVSSFLLFVAAILIILAAAFLAGFRVNLTGSIPLGVYRLETGPVARGSTVLACLPRATAAFARARGYLPRGVCDDGSAPVGKTVAAVGGDTIGIRPDGITVNGLAIPNSRALVRDSHGRGLPSYPVGEYLVGPTEIWLISSFSAGGFDSRYFGPVSRGRVLARIRRMCCFVAR